MSKIRTSVAVVSLAAGCWGLGYGIASIAGSQEPAHPIVHPTITVPIQPYYLHPSPPSIRPYAGVSPAASNGKKG